MIGWSPNSVRSWLTTATGRSVRSTLSTATSSGIDRLTSVASRLVPSLRWTVIDSAASTASAVVMRWPSLRNTTAVLLTDAGGAAHGLDAGDRRQHAVGDRELGLARRAATPRSYFCTGVALWPLAHERIGADDHPEGGEGADEPGEPGDEQGAAEGRAGLGDQDDLRGAGPGVALGTHLRRVPPQPVVGWQGRDVLVVSVVVVGRHGPQVSEPNHRDGRDRSPSRRTRPARAGTARRSRLGGTTRDRRTQGDGMNGSWH